MAPDVWFGESNFQKTRGADVWHEEWRFPTGSVSTSSTIARQGRQGAVESNASSACPRLVDARGPGKFASFGGGTQRALEKVFSACTKASSLACPRIFETYGLEHELDDQIPPNGFGQPLREHSGAHKGIEDVHDKARQLCSVFWQVTDGGCERSRADNGHGVEPWSKASMEEMDPLQNHIRNLVRSVISTPHGLTPRVLPNASFCLSCPEYLEWLLGWLRVWEEVVRFFFTNLCPPLI